MRTETEVRSAATECHVRIRCAAGIEPVGVREDRGVTVGRHHPQRDAVAGRESTASGLGLARDPPRVMQHGRDEPQQLVDHHRRIDLAVDEPPQLGRVLEQHAHRLADEVTGRLGTTEQIVHPVAAQVFFDQRLAVELTVQQVGEEIITRRRATTRELVTEELAERRLRVHHRGGVRPVLRIGVRGDGVAPLHDLSFGRPGHAGEIGHDAKRNGSGDVRHEIAAARGDEIGHCHLGDRPHVGLDATDGAGHERRDHQVAVLRVLRRIHREQHRRVECRARWHDATRARERRPVAVHLLDELVGGDHPARPFGPPPHRSVLTEVRERLERHRLLESRIAQINGDGFHGNPLVREVILAWQRRAWQTRRITDATAQLATPCTRSDARRCATSISSTRSLTSRPSCTSERPATMV